LSCTSANERKEKLIAEKVTKDSLLKANKEKDSIYVANLISNLKKINSVKIEDKKISILDKLKISTKLRFEIEETEYNTYSREIIAERDQTILSIKIKLFSGSKVGKNPEIFFPDLNVYSINKSKNQIKFLGKMDYHLAKKSKFNIRYLEQIFNFKETETFICSFILKKDNQNQIVIGINKNGVKNINPKQIVAIL
jgi:hypothetical protein